MRINVMSWPARRNHGEFRWSAVRSWWGGGPVELIALHTTSCMYTQSHLGTTLRQLTLPSRFLEDTSQSHHVGDPREDSVGTAMYTGLYPTRGALRESDRRRLGWWREMAIGTVLMKARHIPWSSLFRLSDKRQLDLVPSHDGHLPQNMSHISPGVLPLC